MTFSSAAFLENKQNNSTIAQNYIYGWTENTENIVTQGRNTEITMRSNPNYKRQVIMNLGSVGLMGNKVKGELKIAALRRNVKVWV